MWRRRWRRERRGGGKGGGKGGGIGGGGRGKKGNAFSEFDRAELFDPFDLQTFQAS